MCLNEFYKYEYIYGETAEVIFLSPLPLEKSLLNQCCCFWSSWCQSSTQLETIQERGLKIIKSLKNIAWEERLKRFGLVSMGQRQLRQEEFK